MVGRNVVALPPAVVVEHYLRTDGARMPAWVAAVLRAQPWHLLVDGHGVLDPRFVRRIAVSIAVEGSTMAAARRT